MKVLVDGVAAFGVLDWLAVLAVAACGVAAIVAVWRYSPGDGPGDFWIEPGPDTPPDGGEARPKPPSSPSGGLDEPEPVDDDFDRWLRRLIERERVSSPA